MSNIKTAMRHEALETSARIAEQLATNKPKIIDITEKIRQFDPKFVVLVGRGTSDHAALFAKYLFEVETGLAVASAAPSVATTFGKCLKLEQALVIVISQSGQSPDLIEYMQMANKSGAFTVAIANDTSSPLAKSCHHVIPILVGPETAVAATKSYLGSLSAILQLVSHLAESADLMKAVTEIPNALEQAITSPEILKHSDIANIDHCVVIGRGFGFAIGMEIALKLKEICAIQAECFSSAEFLHGPVRIISDNFHVLDILVNDETIEMHRPQSSQLQRRGAIVTHLSCEAEWIHPRIEPLAIMQRFYLDLEQIGREMGLNPDKPEGLSKVTQTR